MRKIMSFATGTTLSLVSLLAGSCRIDKEVSDNNYKLESKNLLEKSKRHVFEFVPFSEFNPSGFLEAVHVESSIEKYLLGGFDVDFGFNNYKIKNYFDFRDDVYKAAGEIGYNSGEIKKMSPRESVELICKIVAHRVDYFGVSQDYSTKLKRKDALEKIKFNLSSLIGNSATPDYQKLNIESKLKHISELEKRWESVEIYENILSHDSGYMVIPADNLSVDELLRGKEPVVCRHYSTICDALFFVLKNENENLKNTWVSSYSDRNHRWNQVSTVEKNGETTNYKISFFDPTWYDLHFKIEGFDLSHFPDTRLLQALTEKLPGEKIIRRLKN